MSNARTSRGGGRVLPRTECSPRPVPTDHPGWIGRNAGVRPGTSPMVCRLPAAKHHSHGRDDRTASPRAGRAAGSRRSDPDPGGSDAPTPGPDVGARRAPTYRLGAGDGTLDLSRLSGADARPVTASVGLGRLRVIVPRDLDVTVHGRAGAGNVTLFGEDRAGREVDRQVTDPAVASTGSITLDLRVGVGHVEVDRA